MKKPPAAGNRGGLMLTLCGFKRKPGHVLVPINNTATGTADGGPLYGWKVFE